MAELRAHGTGPTPAGAPFLGVFRTKRGVNMVNAEESAVTRLSNEG